MTDIELEHPSVMGPAAATPSTSMSLNQAPVFITNQTNKAKYRDSVAKWSTMLRLMSMTDPKAQARLSSVGLILYLAADDDAKETIKQAETEGSIVLEGSEGDQDRAGLIRSIVDLIATDSPTEKIHREVEMLSAIQTCKRRPSESPDVFANRYKCCVARYINQSSVTHPGDDQQWAVMLLRNAMLTPDTLNAITFQLTAGAVTNKKRSPTVTLDSSVVKKVTSAIIAAAASPESTDIGGLAVSLKNACQHMLSGAEKSMTDESPSITLTDALDALRQVRVSTPAERRVPISTMMATHGETSEGGAEQKKRRIDSLKKNTPCFGCGKNGHWFSDRKECIQAMRNKGAQRRDNAGGLRAPFFRQGGQ